MWSFKSKDSKRLPEWVIKMPFEGDQQTVSALVQAGADLREPREMIFCIYANKKTAQIIQKEAVQYGWTCIFSKTATPNAGNMQYFLELKQIGYILNLKNFLDDKTTIQSLAERYDADYDGWYASV